MSDDIDKIRELFNEECRPGLPRWRYIDREDVGVLLAEIDRLKAEKLNHATCGPTVVSTAG